ncbi:hypothetical protein AUEXF2481DRAFT_37018 [Aureobasidium subglaciale EXF-2481]|uniref:SAC domain-containing protein n=1 Tax=Aureobasidium subglaciale (strain EXF-2481) TaxID=1043005 RepID=A0A074YLC7_AURSE|nr:uncharacterized protein AUEXF2481DRAFT_37018 [Aureobasidium subglaciale EXF-2481]KEQ98505.1 hypothetical protein AUEXF2481DRAFT_37018 [Aureobasidium subglaciale EXF-2481]
MPGLVRKLFICAAADGLLLQPLSQRNQQPSSPSVKISYNTYNITPELQQDSEDSTSEGLEAHGLLGLLNLASSSYLVAISKREQIAQIRGKPIYVITDVALIPLASQSEAQHAIQQAKLALKGNKPESVDTSDDEEDSNSTTADDEHDDNASVGSPDEPLHVPKGSINKATTVVTDVIKNKGQYGRFAQRWFSKGGGWKSDGIRKQGMSASEDDLSLTNEQKRQAQDSLPAGKKDEVESAPVDTQSQTHSDDQQPTTEAAPIASGETTLTNLIPRILKTTKLYFTSRSFYFSYDYDISRSLSRQESASASVPLYKRSDPLYFWNHNLAEPLIEAGQHNLVLPVIQGFIGQRAFTVDAPENEESKIVDSKQDASEVVQVQEDAQKENANTTDDKSQAKELLLTLISRRSVKRAGLRYLRRGIDDDGYVANNVETEQILATPSWDSKDKVFSFLQIRGSIPLFFSQSPYSFKPIPIQYGSEATNQAAFKKHFSNMLERYGEVQCASLVDKHGTESKIGESYEKHANSLNSSGGASGKQVGFHWFDFHTVCKGMKFENVSVLMDTLRPTMKSFGWTVHQDGKFSSTQTGVLRTNCMDCLDRTNVVQSGAAGLALQDQLAEMGLTINLQTDPKTSWYNNLWADNGDAISRQYAGTAALKGDFTRTRKRNWQGALTDFSLTLNRYYNNIFGDYFLQTCVDFWLGNAGPVVFEEFETDMMNQDYALDMGRIRQSAIETCVRIVLEDSADMVSGWTLSCPASANTLRALPFEECIVLLTDTALYFCRFDWDTEKVGSFERVELVDVESVNYGTYITSTLGPTHMDEKKNVGFVVKYSSQTPAMVRTNTRSLANEKEAPAAEKDGKKTDVKAAESRLLAFKALPPRNSASKGKNAEGEMTEVEMVRHICEEIERLSNKALDKQTHIAEGEEEQGVKKLHAEQKDVISVAEAKKSTGYLESLGYSLKKLVWS